MLEEWISFCIGVNGHSCQKSSLYRVCTGHGNPGKSWNWRISFSRPGKSINLIVGPWKSWKMKVVFGRLITADGNITVQEKLKWFELTSAGTAYRGGWENNKWTTELWPASY